MIIKLFGQFSVVTKLSKIIARALPTYAILKIHMWTTIIRIAALQRTIIHDTKNAFTEQSTRIHEDVLETLSCLIFN